MLVICVINYLTDVLVLMVWNTL